MQFNNWSIRRTAAIILIHTGVQFVLLPTITEGGLVGLVTIFEWGIALLISALLVLVSIAGHFIPTIRRSFSVIGLAGIGICLLTISYLILSQPYGQWVVGDYSDLGSSKFQETTFRQEIVWFVAAIHFFTALCFLNRRVLERGFQKVALLVLVLVYAVMYTDFAVQKVPSACACDYREFNDLKDETRSDPNLTCYYKYRFMFVKFGRYCPN